MASSVFARTEKKYLLNQAMYQNMLAYISEYMQPDVYALSHITSVYCDTPDYSLICRSLEKPLYKEKLRIRMYGVPKSNEEVFVEVKKKYDGIVYKRRIRMPRSAAFFYVQGLSYDNACALFPVDSREIVARGDFAERARNRQIVRETDAFLQRYEELAPRMAIRCNRKAFATCEADGSDLRVTFDENMRWLPLGDVDDVEKTAIDFAAGNLRGYLISNPGAVIMEVKSLGGLPSWLLAAMQDAKVFPQSFSKYGEAFKRFDATKKKAQ